MEWGAGVSRALPSPHGRQDACTIIRSVVQLAGEEQLFEEQFSRGVAEMERNDAVLARAAEIEGAEVILRDGISDAVWIGGGGRRSGSGRARGRGEV